MAADSGMPSSTAPRDDRRGRPLGLLPTRALAVGPSATVDEPVSEEERQPSREHAGGDDGATAALKRVLSEIERDGAQQHACPEGHDVADDSLWDRQHDPEQVHLAAESFRLLADPTRMKVLWALPQGESSVGVPGRARRCRADRRQPTSWPSSGWPASPPGGARERSSTTQRKADLLPPPPVLATSQTDPLPAARSERRWQDHRHRSAVRCRLTRAWTSARSSGVGVSARRSSSAWRVRCGGHGVRRS